MYRSKYLSFTLIIMCFVFSSIVDEGVIAKKTDPLIVLIPPFENLSGARSMVTYEVGTSSNPNNPKKRYTVDRYSEIPRSILEDLMISKGVRVIERQRLDQLLQESDFIRLSGLVDTTNAIKIGKMLGANTIVMGTINNIQCKKSTFSGYGIRRKTTTVHCSIRVRIIDIESGNIVFSKFVKGQTAYESSNFSSTSDSDVAYSVIEETLTKLENDEDFKSAIMSKNEKL